MSNKRFKILTLVLLGVVSFFAGAKTTNAITSHTFLFDYEWNIQMPKTLTNGENDIVLNAGTEHNSGVNLEDITISYKMTEISKSVYDEFKATQDKIDAKETALKASKDSADTDIKAFENLVNTKYQKNQFWCYNSPIVGKIKLNTDFCGTKYYIVTVNAEDPKVTVMGSTKWEYMTARVYEVKGTKTTCEDKPTNPNPKTGISTPYVICGMVALGAIAVIVVSKKKKYI